MPAGWSQPSGAHAIMLVLERRDGVLSLRQHEGVRPFRSDDPDTERVWWEEVGVNQNLTFPVQPDPVSGMHCWHQKVVVAAAGPEDRFGDVRVDLHPRFSRDSRLVCVDSAMSGARRMYVFDVSSITAGASSSCPGSSNTRGSSKVSRSSATDGSSKIRG